jgi:hypothetical protein
MLLAAIDRFLFTIAPDAAKQPIVNACPSYTRDFLSPNFFMVRYPAQAEEIGF